jgi:hypothetical protein
MSAQEFTAALEAPENDNSYHEQLYRIASKGPIASPALPSVAEAYLQAFCDSTCSTIRRRWAGLALGMMLETSPDVAERLRPLTDKLAEVGQIIVSKTEAEETRVVAGLIIRESIARGIPYRSFWRENSAVAALNNEPTFPKVADATWMNLFQGFVDVVQAAILKEAVTEPLILTLVAIYASDGYKCCGDAKPILLAQGNLLTIISPDASLQHIEFIDVPLRNIESIDCRRSQLHDSQGLQTKVEPWETVVTLRSENWTYHVNSTEHNGDTLKVVFHHKEDATEFENGLVQLLESSSPGKFVSRSRELMLDVSQSSRNTTGNGPGNVFSSADRDSVTVPLPPHRSKNEDTKHTGAMQHKNHNENKTIVPSSSPEARNAPEKKEPPLPETPSRAIKRKAGALPVVNKRFLKESVRRQPTNPEVNDEYDVPEQSPNVAGPVISKNKGARNSRGTTQKGVKDFTKAKPIAPKPKSRRKDNDKEDDQDPISLPEQTTMAPPSPRPRAQKDAVRKQATTSSTASGTSRLSKASRPAKAQPKEARHSETEKEEAKPRQRRKTVDTVAYMEPDTSCDESIDEESSDSEYAENKRGRTRAQATKAHGSRKAASPLISKTARRSRKTKPADEVTQAAALDTRKPSLLANLLSSSSSSKRKIKQLKGRATKTIQDKENAPIFADTDMDDPSNPQASPILGSEINILTRLNFEGNYDEHGVDNNHKFVLQDALLPRKRSREVSIPSTPRSKRARKDHVGAYVSTRTSRVLEDPSSPCGRHGKPSSSSSLRYPGNDMQPPSNPKVDTTTEIVPPGPRQQHFSDPKNLPDTRRTPMHHNSVELLSSNSKPTPASPNAESTAITGHADPLRVDMEKEIAEHEIAKSDPFNIAATHKSKVTSFIRRLTRDKRDLNQPHGASQATPIEIGDNSSSSDLSSRLGSITDPPCAPKKSYGTQMNKVEEDSITVEKPAYLHNSRASEPVQHAAATIAPPSLDVGMSDSVRNPTQQMVENKNLQRSLLYVDDGETLVENEEEQIPEEKRTPVQYPSSPPPMKDDSPSSHSSTSAEPRTDPPVPTSEAEALEWEESLQPHQRALGEQLIRVSRRVVQHIVDKETALDDIADTYQKDGEHLLHTLVDRHNGEFDAMYQEMDKKKTKMKKSCDELLSKLAREQKEVKNMTFDG